MIRSILAAITFLVLGRAASDDSVAQREANEASPDNITTTSVVASTDTTSDTVTRTSTETDYKYTQSTTTLTDTLVSGTTAYTASTSRRISKQARKIYERGKSKVINRSTYYLVDYGMSLDVIADLFKRPALAAAQNASATGSYYRSPQSNSTLEPQNRSILRNAIQSFLQPLMTYQKAQKNEDEEKLSSSLISMLEIISKKAGGQDDTDDDGSAKIGDSDYTPGQLWTSVIRREHVEKVIGARHSIYSSHPQTSTEARYKDRERLQKILRYYQALSPTSSQYTKVIAKHLDWAKFGARYEEVIEKVILVRPDLVRQCRVYLARYLQTGIENKAYYDNLVKDANSSPVSTAGAAAIAMSGLSMLVPIVLSALLLVQ